MDSDKTEKKKHRHKDKSAKHRDKDKTGKEKRDHDTTIKTDALPKHSHMKERKKREGSPVPTTDGQPRKKKGRTASPPPWLSPAAASHSTPLVEFTALTELVYNAARLTPKSLAAPSLGTSEALGTSLSQFAKARLTRGEPWAAGTAWCISHLVQNLATADSDEDMWNRFRSTGGNALHLFADNPTALACFFAKHPEATSCLPFWSDHRSVQPLLLCSAIAEALSLTGDVISAKHLTETLGSPKDLPNLISGLERLAACVHAHPDRAQRLKYMAGALAGSDIQIAFMSLTDIAYTWKLQSATSHQVPTSAPFQPVAKASLPCAPFSATSLPSPSPSPSPEASRVPPWASTHTNSISGKKSLECDETTFKDLRDQWPPRSPTELHARWTELMKHPVSPPATMEFSYTAPSGCDDRECRWHFWQALAQIGFVVHQAVVGTALLPNANSFAGPGAKGQAVVHTKIGTILWMYTSKRVYSPNPQQDLLERLGMIFHPWSPAVAGKAFPIRGPSVAQPAAPQLAAPLFTTMHK